MARSNGQFETRYDNEGLLLGVRHVLERELGLAPGEHVGQRPFDRAAACEQLPGFPSARQIATRLKQPWPEVVRIAWQTDSDAASYSGAAMHATRADERDLDDRDTIAALSAVARHLDVESLVPGSYETGREALLEQARRDGTLEHWRELLPTAHQITQANDKSWDLALAKAGLHLRPGAELSKAAWQRVRALHRRLGLPVVDSDEALNEPGTAEELARLLGDAPNSLAEPQATPTPTPAPTPEPEPEPKRMITAPRSGRQAKPATKDKYPTAKTPPSTETATASAGADEPAARGPGRGGSARVHRKALTPTRAVAEFARQQQGWPHGRGALDGWSKHYDVAVKRAAGVEDLIGDAARLLENEGVQPPAPQVRIAARHMRLDLPRPDGLPRRVKDVTREACLEAIERRYRDVPGRRKLTRGFYVSWPPGAHGAPAASQFDKFGGFAKLRDEVHERLGR